MLFRKKKTDNESYVVKANNLMLSGDTKGAEQMLILGLDNYTNQLTEKINTIPEKDAALLCVTLWNLAMAVYNLNPNAQPLAVELFNKMKPPTFFQGTEKEGDAT